MSKITLSKADQREIRRLYEKEGWLQRELAEYWDVSMPTMRRLLQEAGTKMRPRGAQPKEK